MHHGISFEKDICFSIRKMDGLQTHALEALSTGGKVPPMIFISVCHIEHVPPTNREARGGFHRSYPETHIP
jgi:hypothetical protein